MPSLLTRTYAYARKHFSAMPLWLLALLVIAELLVPLVVSAQAASNVRSPYHFYWLRNIWQRASVSTTSSQVVSPPSPAATSSPTASTPLGNLSYDAIVLSDKPVMYLPMSSTGATEIDKTGNSHNGTYKGGSPITVTMPNGDKAADFNGSSQYLTVPSSPALSIPTSGELTWEAWIRPGTLQFSKASSDGYVDWMGKCQNYSPSCEWEARMYSLQNAESRTNRISAYVFNNSAGYGSGADWQPATSIVRAGDWLHVVGEYQTKTTPSQCSKSYPGSISIWVNGVKWNFGNHAPTGCMSQYNITPRAGNSPLNIGTMAFDTWFKGAIGKVAIYDYLLTDAQIGAHYKAMTGKSPSGSCGNTCTYSH